MDQCLALSEIEGESGSCPCAAQTYVLEIVVENETSDTENSGIVSSHDTVGVVGHFVATGNGLVDVVACNNVQLSLNPGDVTDVN